VNPRARLSLLVTAVVVLGVLAVLTLARTGGPAEGLAAGISSEGSPYAGATRPDAPSPEFRLHDQHGRTTTIEQFRGQPVIVTFLYSHCEDTCPAAARQIAAALDTVGTPVPTLAISVDPGGDTQDSTQRFLNKMRLGTRARFLLGTRAELAPVWKAYGIEPQGTKFDHSAYVLILDGRGRQRVAFPVDKLTPEGLAHDLRVVRAQDAAASRAG
jgi:protein SCO1/2